MWLRLFRSNLFEHVWADRAGRVHKSCLILLIVSSIAASAAGSSSLGQELGHQPGQTVVEPVDDDMGADLMVAMKSLDETLNKKDALAERMETRNRLVGFAVFSAAFLAIIGVLFGYLRLDHATRGFHSGRLQMLAAFAVVLILTACYFLWTQVLFK